MKKTGTILLIASLNFLVMPWSFGQTNLYQQFLKFNELYYRGNFKEAEKCMLLVLNSASEIPSRYLIAAYNDMGLIRKSTGLYTEALNYYNLAEAVAIKSNETKADLADIYINKSRILKFRKSYNRAINYLEKAVRLYQGIPEQSDKILRSTSTAFLNLGIIYYELDDYRSAIEFLSKSAAIKQKYSLPEIEMVYLNLAKTYDRLADNFRAEEYYHKSIGTIERKSGSEYYRLADVYFDYGSFLLEKGRYNDALKIHFKALFISLKYYGIKHPVTATANERIADDFVRLKDYSQALNYYQEAMISVVNDFGSRDIDSNPAGESSLDDITLLDNLKAKSRVLELVSDDQGGNDKKIPLLRKSYETIMLAIKVIRRIRGNYLTSDSRMYLDAHEKETYVFTVDLLNNLYSLTSEKWIPEAMYTITQNAKAADLQSELARNRMLLSSSLGDSLHQRQSVINSQTTAYRYLINEENKGERPDSAKISRLKDDLFELDRERERVNDQIEKKFPQYHGSSEEFGLVSVDEIRKRLKRGEVVLNYLLSNRFEEGKRKLYTFVLTKHRLDIRESYLDTLFASNARIIEKSNDQSMMEGGKGSDYRANTGALWYMYANLIRPVEGLIKGRRLIIIPDEEISRLPFEAFIRELPEAGMSDYEGLKYLIRDYSFSYAYASAQVVLRESQREGPVKVYAFSPDYGDKSQKVKDTRSLEGANREISSIYRWFHGRSYSENSATLTNFRQIVHNPAVIHLAMHSYSDEANSSYSYLLFDNRQDTTNGGRLYNYEISVIRVNSPMVVLSACNSGSGTLYQGEGLLSIARSFMLAGATSVINTAWEINDDASAGIITRFYYHLSKGDPKDEAMRLAKLDYLKNSPTVYANPYYWASYKVTGSVQALRARVPNKYVMILFLAVVAGSAAFLLYLRRRRILSALP